MVRCRLLARVLPIPRFVHTGLVERLYETRRRIWDEPLVRSAFESSGNWEHRPDPDPDCHGLIEILPPVAGRCGAGWHRRAGGREPAVPGQAENVSVGSPQRCYAWYMRRHVHPILLLILLTFLLPGPAHADLAGFRQDVEEAKKQEPREDPVEEDE